MELRVMRDEEPPGYDEEPAKQTGWDIVSEAPRFAMLWESVLFDHELTPSAKVVYAVLQRYSTRYGAANVFPTQERIADDAGLKDRKTVSAALDALERRGHIRRESRGFGETRRIILAAPSNVQKTDISVCPKNGQMMSKKRTNDVQKTDTITRESKREKDDEETAKGAGKNSPSRDSQPNPSFALFAAICDAADLDPSAFIKTARNKQLGICKRLADQGVTDADVRACVGWLRSQSWRTSPVDAVTVASQIGTWMAAGRPAKAQEVKRSVSQADLNRGGTGKFVP